jgi:hypothetical protein
MIHVSASWGIIHLLLRLLQASHGLSLLVQPFTGSLVEPPGTGFVSIDASTVEELCLVFYRVERSGWVISVQQKFMVVVQEKVGSRGDRGIKV